MVLLAHVRRALVPLVVVAAAMAALGAGWSSREQPQRLQPLDLDVLAAPPVAPPPPVVRALAELPGVDATRATTLVERDGLVLAAAPTADGNLCLVVADAEGATTAGCGAALTADRPLAALVVTTAAGRHAAGVAEDGVERAEALGATGVLCAAEVERNGFTCPLVDDEPVNAWRATTASGVVTFAAQGSTDEPAAEPIAPPQPLVAMASASLARDVQRGVRPVLLRVDPTTLRVIPGDRLVVGRYAAPSAASPDGRRMLLVEPRADAAVVRTVDLQTLSTVYLKVVQRGREARIEGAAWPEPRRAVLLTWDGERQGIAAFDPLNGQVARRAPLPGGRRWRLIAAIPTGAVVARGALPSRPPELLVLDAQGSVARSILLPSGWLGSTALSPDGGRLVLAPLKGGLLDVDLTTGAVRVRSRPDVPSPDASVSWRDGGHLLLGGALRRERHDRRTITHLATWEIDATTWTARRLPAAGSSASALGGLVLVRGWTTFVRDRTAGNRPEGWAPLTALTADGRVAWRRDDLTGPWLGFQPSPDGTRLYVQRMGTGPGPIEHRGDVVDVATGETVGRWQAPRGRTLWLLPTPPFGA